MATFILVHGSFHGAWCWDRLTPLLTQRGHRVVAPDLPASASDPAPRQNAGLRSYATRIAARIDEEAGPVILVGHSMGGIVASQVAEWRHDRIAAAVYICGLLLRSGETLATFLQAHADLARTVPRRRGRRRGRPADLLPAHAADARAPARGRRAPAPDRRLQDIRHRVHPHRRRAGHRHQDAEHARLQDDVRVLEPRRGIGLRHHRVGGVLHLLLRDMIKLIGDRSGLSPQDAYTLCSIAADLRVTQMVDGNKGIHCVLEKSKLPARRRA